MGTSGATLPKHVYSGIISDQRRRRTKINWGPKLHWPKGVHGIAIEQYFGLRS